MLVFYVAMKALVEYEYPPQRTLHACVVVVAFCIYLRYFYNQTESVICEQNVRNSTVTLAVHTSVGSGRCF